jgi:hypothetical protein
MIRNFLQDQDPDTDPSLGIIDSVPDPKQEMHFIENHLKVIKNMQFDTGTLIMTLKKRYI